MVLRTPVNTGIGSRPTDLGTFPVYLHLTSTTMAGTNPDGSHYNDPGVPWVNYFSGGDAVHGFYRGSYGWPQSLGCVEVPVVDGGDDLPVRADRDARHRHGLSATCRWCPAKAPLTIARLV